MHFNYDATCQRVRGLPHRKRLYALVFTHIQGDHFVTDQRKLPTNKILCKLDRLLWIIINIVYNNNELIGNIFALRFTLIMCVP